MLGRLGDLYEGAVKDDGKLSIAFSIERQPCGYKDGEWAFPDDHSFQQIALIEDSSALDPVEFIQRVQEAVQADIEKIAAGHFNQYLTPESIYLVNYAVVARHGWAGEDEHSAVISVQNPAGSVGNLVRRYEIAKEVYEQLLEKPVDESADPDDELAQSLIRLYADFFRQVDAEKASELGLCYDYHVDDMRPA